MNECRLVCESGDFRNFNLQQVHNLHRVADYLGMQEFYGEYCYEEDERWIAHSKETWKKKKNEYCTNHILEALAHEFASLAMTA